MKFKYAKRAALFMALLLTLNVIPAGAVFAEGTETVFAVPEDMQTGQTDGQTDAEAGESLTSGTDTAVSGGISPEQEDPADAASEDEEESADQAEGQILNGEYQPGQTNAEDTDGPDADETGEVGLSDISETVNAEENPNEDDTEPEGTSGRGAGSIRLLTVSGSGTSRTITVAETSAAYSSMKAAVWSDAGGQDDLKWHTMTKQADGSFAVTISVAGLFHSGTCYVHVYSGSSFIDGEVFNVAEEELAEFRLKITGDGASRTITLPGIYDDTAFKAAVWSKEGGQDDLKWHELTKQSDGSFSVQISAADLKHTGVCYVHVYSGSRFIDGSAFVFTEQDMAALKLTVTGSDGERTITLPAGYSVTSLRAAVWSKTGGQDDLNWYDMTKGSDGSWTAVISADSLLHTGTCVVHVYSGSTFIDGNTFTIDADEVTLPSLSMSASEGARTLTLSDGSGLNNVKVALWSEAGGQDDLKWYDMDRQSDGSWTLEISVGIFAHSGTCYAHVYSGDTFVAGKEFQITSEEYDEIGENTFTISGTGGRRILTVAGPYTGLSSLKAAVWSETGGQDDLKWYTAEKQSDGTWKIDISVSVLLSSGTVNVHGYSGSSFEFGITFGLSDSEFESAVQDLTHQYAQSILSATGGTLRGVYDWAVQNITYQSLVTPLTVPSSGTWSVFTRQELYLVYAYERLKGNCFCYAAPVFWCAKELGYTVRLMEYMYNYGNDPNILRPHGWVEIDINGGTYILDAELQHEYGMNCFMIQSSPLQLRRDVPAY